MAQPTTSRRRSGWRRCAGRTASWRNASPRSDDFLVTDEGEPRQKLAGKKLTDARPDLLAWLTELQQRFCIAAERRRAARAAGLAEAALLLIDAVRRDFSRAKRLRGVLDYDDLIIKTRNLLEKQARRPGCSTSWMAASSMY